MRLLSLSIEEILQLSEKLEKEIKAVKEDLIRMCWFMRGGLTLEEAYNTDYQDREIIAKLIESNLELTQKTKMAFF